MDFMKTRNLRLLLAAVTAAGAGGAVWGLFSDDPGLAFVGGLVAGHTFALLWSTWDVERMQDRSHVLLKAATDAFSRCDRHHETAVSLLTKEQHEEYVRRVVEAETLAESKARLDRIEREGKPCAPTK